MKATTRRVLVVGCSLDWALADIEAPTIRLIGLQWRPGALEMVRFACVASRSALSARMADPGSKVDGVDVDADCDP